MVGPLIMARNTLWLWRNREEIEVRGTMSGDERQGTIEREQKRKAKLESILQSVSSHGVREAFLESYSQLVTQSVIIFSTGNIFYTQIISLTVSLM